MMQEQVGIIRKGDRLVSALAEIEKFRERAARAVAPGSREYNGGWHTALDLDSLLTSAEAVARAALAREESRGAHTRDDFPSKSKDWGKVNLVIRKGVGGQMEVERVPVPALPPELASIVEEMG
jgi:succinate dehydrogenase / fumarate reductase flavoprotein subunit